MKIAAVAAFGMLIMLPGEAELAHRQHALPRTTTCDNDDHSPSEVEATAGYCKNRSKTQKTSASAQHRFRATDANGNPADIVIFSKKSARD